MASNFKISDAARSAACDGIVDLLDGGTPPGKIEIRTGAPPTNVSDASTGSLLATVLFHATQNAFGAAASGVATANDFQPDTNATGGGDAGYFRAYPGGAGDTGAVFQGTAGEAADTPDMTFDEKTIVATGTVDITALTVTVPTQ